MNTPEEPLNQTDLPQEISLPDTPSVTTVGQSRLSIPSFIFVLIGLLLLGVGSLTTYFAFTSLRPNNNTPVVVNPTPSVVPTQTTYSDQTAWKTYTNSTYGFSFKYPSTGVSQTDNGIKIEECGTHIEERDEKFGHLISIDNFFGITISTIDSSLQNVLDTDPTYRVFNKKIVSVWQADEAFELDGIKPNMEPEGGPVSAYLFIKKGKMLITFNHNNGVLLGCFSPNIVDKVTYPDYAGLQWDVKDTFRFIELPKEKVSISGWELYKNTAEKYMVHHPKTWTDLTGQCSKVTVSKFDSKEPSIYSFAKMKLGFSNSTNVEEIAKEAASRYSIPFSNFSPTEAIVFGPQGEGELNDIFVKIPAGYLQIGVVYNGPVPDIHNTCKPETINEYKDVLATLQLL